MTSILVGGAGHRTPSQKLFVWKDPEEGIWWDPEFLDPYESLVKLS
jgi:hypothetical protein